MKITGNKKVYKQVKDQLLIYPYFMANREKTETVTVFSWAPKLLWMLTAAMKLKDTCSLEEKAWQT